MHRHDPSDSGRVSQPEKRKEAAVSDETAVRDLPPLTDEEYADHIRMLEFGLDEAERQGMSSQRLYTDDPDGKAWTKSRADQQVGPHRSPAVSNGLIGDLREAELA